MGKVHMNRAINYNPTTQSVLFMDSYINLSVIALLTGLSVSYVSMIFAGKRNPSLRAARLIVGVLGSSSS